MPAEVTWPDEMSWLSTYACHDISIEFYTCGMQKEGMR